MADNTVRPGYYIEVEGFIPVDSKAFTINLGTDDSNYVLHFNPRFDTNGDIRKIVLNTKVNDVWGDGKTESFFPFQEGSNTKVSFTFEKDKIIIKLPTGNPLSFPIRFPITGIPYFAVKNLHLKSVIVK
ncbi:galectin-1-like [Rana temporaria]|uniref:galectin-1-like n=1 Tax=Rana temporaria TaxID=8407 RepID=UPI001AAD0B7B|nr:galectin-1-like [Rana temporaria]